jgi:N-acetylmuramoyl-L-alanine amidase
MFLHCAVRKIFGFVILGLVWAIPSPAFANQSLFFAYSSPHQTTTFKQIFSLGVTPPTAEFLINGKTSQSAVMGNIRGENLLYWDDGNQDAQEGVQLVSHEESLASLTSATDAISDTINIARLAGELLCFGASIYPKANFSVQLGDFTLPLVPQWQPVQLVALDGGQQADCQPISFKSYQRTNFINSGYGTRFHLGNPQSLLKFPEQPNTQEEKSNFRILPPFPLQVVEVTSDSGITRTGASEESSRLTPLPKGTRAKVTGRQGEWLRLDYGAWINIQEVKVLESTVPASSIISKIKSRKVDGKTEIIFPLEAPVPLGVEQDADTFSLTLYNTKSQKDVISVGNDPIISAVDWQQAANEGVKYTFNLKNNQQWGYKLRYEGNSLILSLRHPPQKPMFVGFNQPLAGIKIVLDPGHGGNDPGAVGPNKYQEKEGALSLSMLLRDELTRRGATVYMTREDDRYLSLRERVDIINRLEPTIALSVHYNSVPEDADPQDAQGVSMFWYHPQAKKLAKFLHDSLVEQLKRPSHGVRWKNLALARPTTAPSVLMELGFISHPREADWIANPYEQERLAAAVADAVVGWFDTVRE